MEDKLVCQKWCSEAKNRVSYFDDSKSLIQVKIFEKFLDTLNFQMRKDRRNVSLFLDNSTVHSTSLINIAT